MKWRWREGLEHDANTNNLSVCWTFLIYIFLHQLSKPLSRIYTSKFRRNLQTFGWCLQFKKLHPWDSDVLLFACENKQGNYCNWHKSFKDMCLRKVQHYLSFLNKEKTLAVLIPLTLLPKNHNLLRTWRMKRRAGKEESPCPPTHNADV